MGEVYEDQHIMDTQGHTGPHGNTDEHRQEIDVHGNYPENQQFVPVEQLSTDNLPNEYQSPDLVNYIQAFADLVVSITVNYVSEERPEKSPGSDKLYPCHGMKGSDKKRQGTGFISDVYKFPDKHIPEFVKCECSKCLVSLTPKKEFAHIAIRTSTHLVFDDKEASETTCKIFDKKGRSFELSGMWRVISKVPCDWCLMIYVTHDMELVDMIKKQLTHSNKLKATLVTNRLLSMTDKENGKNNKSTLQGKLNVTISHMNEHDKQVGIVHHEHVNETEAHSHGHISASVPCPGSCGAPVLVIEKDLRLSGFEHTHSGHYRSEINSSGQGIGFTPFNHKHGENKNNLEKCFENKTTEECWNPECQEGHEADLKKDVECKKNPGHKNFIPADDFKMEHLLHGFQNVNVLDCILAVKALTVIISVCFTSDDRPETFPDSNEPYTGNEYKGKRSKRTGTGLVHDIVTFQGQNCPCRECSSSPSPENQFAYVTIHSAAHVVFDDHEGQDTKCHLFFDRGRTLDACSDVKELKEASRVWCDVYKDTSKIIFVTHDKSLIKNLCKKVTHWQELQQTLEHGFIISSTKVEDDRDHGLTVIASHPHGCHKHISIGHCNSMHAKGRGYTECHYTTPTCPGSSGAYVFVVGKFWKCWNKHHYGV